MSFRNQRLYSTQNFPHTAFRTLPNLSNNMTTSLPRTNHYTNNQIRSTYQQSLSHPPTMNESYRQESSRDVSEHLHANCASIRRLPRLRSTANDIILEQRYLTPLRVPPPVSHSLSQQETEI